MGRVSRCLIREAHYCFVRWKWDVIAEADGGAENRDIARSPQHSSSASISRPQTNSVLLATRVVPLVIVRLLLV